MKMNTNTANLKEYVKDTIAGLKESNAQWVKKFQKDPYVTLSHPHDLVGEVAKLEEYNSLRDHLNQGKTGQEIIPILKEELFEQSQLVTHTQSEPYSVMSLARLKAKVKIIQYLELFYYKD